MYTSIYAAVAGLFFIGLSARVILLRRKFEVPVGHGGEEALQRAIRVHGNFAEYVPLALILLFMLEKQGAWPSAVNTLGVILLVGRCLHAFGVSDTAEDYRFRIVGMNMTFLVILSCALGLIFFFAQNWFSS